MATTHNTNFLSSDRIQSQYDEDLVLCSICHNVLWHPVACKTCENSFCHGCIQQWMKQKPNNKCPFNCQYEERKCTAAIVKTLSKLHVKCRYQEYGCTGVVPYEALEKHELECDYQLKHCQGCEERKLKKDFEEHQLQCEEIVLKCMTCNSAYKRKQLKQHTEIQCLQQQFEQQKYQHEQQMQQLKHQHDADIRQMKSEFQLLRENLLKIIDQKLKAQQTIVDDRFESQQLRLNTVEQEMKTLKRRLENERFNKSSTSNVRFEDNNRLVVHGEPHGHCEVRGRNLYSNGFHRIQFQIEKMLNNEWISFGIIHESTPLASNSYNSSSFYGWGQCKTQSFLNGKIQSGYGRYDGDIKEGDRIELNLNCGDKQIKLLNKRSGKQYEMPIDLQCCPYPWQISLNLVNPNDCVRILE